LLQTNRLSEAEKLFRQAVMVAERLAERFPTVPEYQSLLGARLNNCAGLLGDVGKVEEGRQFLTRAVRCQRPALQADPTKPKYRTYLPTHSQPLAEFHVKWGDHAAAAAAAKELAQVFPGNWRECHSAARILARCLALPGRDARLSAAEQQAQSRSYAEQALAL